MTSRKPRVLAPVPPFTEAYHAPLETEPLRKDQEDALHQELAAAVRRALDEAWCPCPSEPLQSKPHEKGLSATLAQDQCDVSLTGIPSYLIALAAQLEQALQTAAERRSSATRMQQPSTSPILLS